VWKRIELGRDSEGTFLSVGLCVSSGKTSAVMFGLILAINIVAVAFASVQAYQTRNLSVAYHESKFVGLSLASILQSLLIGIPLLFLTNQNGGARFIIRTILIFAICMSVLCFIFIPKMTRQKPTPGQTNRNSSVISGSFMGKSNIRSSSRILSTKGNIKSSIIQGSTYTSNGSNTASNEEVELLKEEIKRLQIIVAQPQTTESN
jgi:competence protein ComGC